jgi:hypothetical protein
MTNAAMQADYCDLKIIKTRKVIQVVLEIPQEAGDAFIAAFGLPRSDKNVPVAIARLNPGEVAWVKERKPGGELARRAGIVCGEKAFWKFLDDTPQVPNGVINADGAADELRSLCGIRSRAELDHNPEAAAKFNNLMAEYNAWLSHG